MLQVVGLGASGRAAVKLALARGADTVVALDSNPSSLKLEVGFSSSPKGFYRGRFVQEMDAYYRGFRVYPL